MAAVAYERWSFTRGAKCSDVTGIVLVFWKTGRCGEVGATRGSTVLLCSLLIKMSRLHAVCL